MGPLVSLCVNRATAARFPQNCWGNFSDVKNFLHPFDVNNFWGRIFGEEFLGKNVWGIIFGQCVLKTMRHAAQFSQNCWGHDVRNIFHPFIVNNLGGRTFGEEF